MSTYIHIYIYIHTYTFMFVYMCSIIHIQLHIHLYINILVCRYIYIYTSHDIDLCRRSPLAVSQCMWIYVCYLESGILDLLGTWFITRERAASPEAGCYKMATSVHPSDSIRCDRCDVFAAALWMTSAYWAKLAPVPTTGSHQISCWFSR